MRIREFEPRDIPFALEQTVREGWDCTAEFFRMLLTHDPGGAWVAEIEGERAGMVTTTRYEKSAWIGNLIVPPEYRQHSVGSSLMQHAIQRLEQQGKKTLRLEGDPLGINIYRRLGFVDEFDSPRFRMDQCSFQASASVRELAEQDLPAVFDLDATVFGDDRKRMLELLIAGASKAYVLWRGTILDGYLLVQKSAQGVRLGPAICRDENVARGLIATALSETKETLVVIALPGLNSAGRQVLLEMGFQETPSSLRMVRGPVVASGTPRCVYALASGAIG